jgi:hypothetical protein
MKIKIFWFIVCVELVGQSGYTLKDAKKKRTSIYSTKYWIYMEYERKKHGKNSITNC